MIAPDPATGAPGSGPTVVYAYDAAGDTVSVTDPLGLTTFYAYDRSGRLVVTADPSSQVTSATWSGSTLVLASPLGNETFTYDATGGLTRVSGTLPGIGSVVFDRSGNRAATVDALGSETDYTYDALNRLTSVTQPLVLVADGTEVRPRTTYAYDAAGNTVSVTDPLGHATFYAYDRADRLVVKADASSGVTSAAWSGSTLTLSSTLGAETFSYDSAGRVVRIWRSLPGVTNTEYNALGNRVASVDPLGNETDYSYDALNRVTAVSEPAVTLADGTRTRPTTTYGYDADGNTVR